MNSRVDYRRLRTIDDVRAQRRRVNRELGHASRRLSNDWEDFKEMFTLDYWLGQLARGTSNLTGVIHSAVSGFNMVASLFKKRK